MGPVVVAGQTLIAGVFVVSAVAKVRDGTNSERFAATALRLAGLTSALARPVATVTVAGEIAVVMLLVGAPALPPAHSWLVTSGFTLALVLLLGFSAALVVAVQAGSTTPCGCFGGSSVTAGRRHLVRNAVLLAVAAAGAWAAATGPTRAPVLSAGSMAAAAVGLALAVVLVMFDDLIALFSGPRRRALTDHSRRYP